MCAVVCGCARDAQTCWCTATSRDATGGGVLLIGILIRDRLKNTLKPMK